jgi:hypothetical protein
MSVFLSYASVDRKLAEKLKEELGKSGLSVWSDTDLAAGEEWRHRLEEAIHSASEILVLVGPKNGDDPWQQLTWRAALESVWQDPSKRLIPILLRGASLPAFVLSGTSGELEAVRVEDPRHIRSAAQAILDLIQGHRTRGAGKTGKKGAKIFSVSADDDGRDTRLSTIETYAEHMRTASPTRD